MPEIKAYAPGIYARSEELIGTTRDLDRGRASEEAVQRQRTEDLRRFIEVQKDAGLDYVSDGLLNWQDIFRPFDEAAEGLEPGPLTRFLATNTFFRAPAVTAGVPRLPEPLGETFFNVGKLPRGRWVATLPSPYATAVRAAGEVDPETIAEGVIAPQIRWLAENGCAMVVLQETALLSGGKMDIGSVREAVRALKSALPLALQLPFGDAGGVLGELAEIEVDAIGVDFYRTDPKTLPRPFPKALLAGVVDAQNSLLEETEDLARFGRKLLEELDCDLHLVPNGDLQFVPEGIAREKILRLGAAARALREDH